MPFLNIVFNCFVRFHIKDFVDFITNHQEIIGSTVSVFWKLYRKESLNSSGVCGHYDNSVGKKDGFFNIMCDIDYCLFCVLSNLQNVCLKFHSSDGIQCTKWFVHK